jgi:hypothetical protein
MTTMPDETVAQLFAKLSKEAQRSMLADLCDIMIERHKWDDIAAFLIGRFGPEDAPVILKMMRSLDSADIFRSPRV